MSQYSKIFNKLFKEFYGLCKEYGFLPALYTLVWWINFYCPSPLRFKLSRWALLRKTRWLDKYINSKYSHIINHYVNAHVSRSRIEIANIWVFWGQGPDCMPVLVKSCYDQLTRYYKNIILLTLDNISEYIDIPQSIKDKANTGTLSWANFSDIVRNKILYRYGGLWLDATVWTTDDIPFGQLMNMPFYSANGDVCSTKNSNCFWTSFKYNWSTWCMWSNQSLYPLFGFVGDMMEAVAENEKIWPDYVFQDFLIYYAIHHFDYLKQDFNRLASIPCNNRNKLSSLMNYPYNEDDYKALCINDFVFKLSFRTPWRSMTSEGEITYFGKLIEHIENTNIT